MGCEADCSLIATRAEEPTRACPAYTKCAVMNAPDDLPDGYYEVTFRGHSAFLHRTNGVWGLGVPWHEVPRRAEAA